MLGNRLALCANRLRCSVMSQQSRHLAEVINLSPSEISEEPESLHDEQPDVNSRKGKYSFMKLNYNSPLFTQALLKVKGRKPREKNGLILLEGRRLVQEALDAGCIFESIFFSRNKDLDKLEIADAGNKKIYKVAYNDMKVWSPLTTPPGIIGICRLPSPLPETQDSLPLTVICDQIREPGNLGSMIRNCAGVGVRRVLLTPGCTDLWDLKTLRGGAGAHFKVRVHPDIDWPEIGALVRRENSQLLLASSATDDNDGNSFLTNVPTMPYWAPDYTQNHNFIVIGGETEGISQEACTLALQTNGFKLNIPLANNVDSLNSVCAASVIMFEIRKQLMAELEDMD